VTVPGMLIDAKERIALCLVSDTTIGVAVNRYDSIPPKSEIERAAEDDAWIAAYRRRGSDLFKVKPPSLLGKVSELPGLTAQDHEASQFVIQLCLASWPEWGPLYRSLYDPLFFIPFFQTPPEG